ncbi:hypothetical protein R1sor_000898 [Riccia sorocarpa]|uniref:Uncharacterized protein n=1 Tax=Riccia sorocarpa TaxID=122646 RepID=A0ABD3GWE8_9MARC
MDLQFGSPIMEGGPVNNDEQEVALEGMRTLNAAAKGPEPAPEDVLGLQALVMRTSSPCNLPETKTCSTRGKQHTPAEGCRSQNFQVQRAGRRQNGTVMRSRGRNGYVNYRPNKSLAALKSVIEAAVQEKAVRDALEEELKNRVSALEQVKVTLDEERNRNLLELQSQPHVSNAEWQEAKHRLKQRLDGRLE